MYISQWPQARNQVSLKGDYIFWGNRSNL